MQKTLTVSEDIGELILLVESDGSNVDTVTVMYLVQNQTAQGCELCVYCANKGIFISLSLSLDGSDFLVGIGSLLFPPASTQAAITVPVIDDRLPERAEFFTVSLLPAQDVVFATDEATVTINDNDG